MERESSTDAPEPDGPVGSQGAGEAIIASPSSDFPIEYRPGVASALAFALVRLAEIVGQTVRWLAFCYTGLSALSIVVAGWADMNLQAQHWWQSPLAAIVVTASACSIFLVTLSMILVFNGKPSNRVSADELASILRSKQSTDLAAEQPRRDQ